MSLSIIIPAFEESAKIVDDIRAATAFLKEHDIHGEIIVIDDGSQDSTAAQAEKVSGCLLIKEKNFRYLSRRPSFRQSNDSFDAIGLAFITQGTMEFFQFSYFFF